MFENLMPRSPEKKSQPSPNIPLEPLEQDEIVQIANGFKRSVQSHAQAKKEAMRTCYAYAKGQFVGGDLLPTPSTLGNDRDLNSGRPKIFVPLMRQQLKQLFSYLKLTLFPNEDNYFRLRGKNAAAVALENDLTEGLKQKFKEAMLTEKMGQALYNLCWAGNAAVFPTIRKQTLWEWRFDAKNQQYVPYQVDLPPQPDLEVFNPLAFYMDPTATDPDCAKWAYFSTKKQQEMKDNPLFFNLDKITGLASKQINTYSNRSLTDINLFNGLGSLLQDTEESVDYDLYYFPHLQTSRREYRNMLIGIVGEQVIVRFHPNLFPRGMNPAVFFNWMPDVDSQYGTGPAEDIKELQRLVNILYNYMIEVLARIGNRFVVGPDVDLSNLFGVAGGVARAQNPGSDVVALTGNFGEISQLADIIGTAKAEAQVTAGAQVPFQGASNIDFKKTATEMQILQENSISVIREVIEHVSVTGIQRILERMMYLCADLYPEPFEVRVADEKGQSRFVTVDFQILKSGQFELELIGINPSQSKQAQVNSLMQLLDLVTGKPDVLMLGEPILRQIATLQGLKDGQAILEQIKAKLEELRHGSTESPISGAEDGLGADAF